MFPLPGSLPNPTLEYTSKHIMDPGVGDILWTKHIQFYIANSRSWAVLSRTNETILWKCVMVNYMMQFMEHGWTRETRILGRSKKILDPNLDSIRESLRTRLRGITIPRCRGIGGLWSAGSVQKDNFGETFMALYSEAHAALIVLNLGTTL